MNNTELPFEGSSDLSAMIKDGEFSDLTLEETRDKLRMFAHVELTAPLVDEEFEGLTPLKFAVFTKKANLSKALKGVIAEKHLIHNMYEFIEGKVEESAFNMEAIRDIPTNVLASDLGLGFSLMAWAVVTEDDALKNHLYYLSVDRISSPDMEYKEYAFAITDYSKSETRQAAKFLINKDVSSDKITGIVARLHTAPRLAKFKDGPLGNPLKNSSSKRVVLTNIIPTPVIRRSETVTTSAGYQKEEVRLFRSSLAYRMLNGERANRLKPSDRVLA